jgi:hypothetical protein
LRRDKPLNGYLDRTRRNIHALDESIEDVRKVPKGEKPVDKRARLKLLRDLVELQNSTLVAVKTHLLGRDETGAANEPPDHWEGNDQIEFERYFKNQLSPWTLQDLKLKCVDCGVKNEDVSERYIPEEQDEHYNVTKESERVDLCPACLKKRSIKDIEETEEDQEDEEETPGSTATGSNASERTMIQTARLYLKALKGLPLERQIADLEGRLSENMQVAPGMEQAYQAYRGLLQKALDEAKASHPNPTSQS